MLALQLVGTPSIAIENISDTNSAGPGVGLDIDILYVVCSLGSIV